MSEYNVCILLDASKSYTVEADTPEQAVEKAEELHWENAISLCHQCSAQVELADSVGAVACLDGAEVLDTTYGGQRIAALESELARLRGLVPELPPRPPEGEGMPRYGLRWNGPSQPVSVPMADGYWTPWHLAEAERDTLRQQLEAITDISSSYLRELEAANAHRDKLAGLLREANGDLGAYPDSMTFNRDLVERIDAALAEVKS